ncbi:MAG: hypothetical protein HXX13_00215 [Bacteroidetes bacterium]|nr:hypothetical protein [Bacteroidota bacterium]
MKEKAVNQKKGVPGKVKEKAVAKPASSLFELLDNYLDKSFPWLIWVLLGLVLLFSLLLFDQKISLAGDDSSYIIRASEFIHSFKYPGFQGPLYPMFLGLVVAIFGISLIPLKIVSLLAMMGFFYVTLKTFKNRVPSTILFFSLLVATINSYLLYYASQTYNESFYLLIQSLLIYVFFSRFIDQGSEVSLKSDILNHLMLAGCLLAVTLTKNIGFSAIFAVLGYFLLKGQWKNLLYAILAFAAVFLVFQGIRYALWREGGLQFASQGSGLLNKDYYLPQNGKEDFAGMVKRFTDNSQLYFSKHLLYMTGFRSYVPSMPLIPMAAIGVYFLALVSLIFTYRKNAYLFFIGLLSGSFLIITFIVLQAKWDQGRLIIPALTFLIMVIFSSLYYFTQLKKWKALQFILPVLAVVIFFQTFADTTVEIKKTREATGRYGGLTPDWKHYLQASEWAAENLPPKAIVACRKPSISFVYGKGRNFYGIMQIPSFSLDQFYAIWKEHSKGMVAFSYADFSNKQLPAGMFDTLKHNMLAQFYVGDKFYFIEQMPDSLMQKTLLATEGMHVPGITSVESMKEIVKLVNKPATVIYPDSLLNLLIQNRVTHVLTANLRRNSFEKNGQIINTVERYLGFIEDKYPGFMSKVTQIGSDDNEPAAILKLEYDKTEKVLNP